ncbi:hypothetical protein XENOCAPTIV_015778, partial [Xenoophorus captivus]
LFNMYTGQYFEKQKFYAFLSKSRGTKGRYRITAVAGVYHETTVRDLEETANDQSSRIEELEATVSKLTPQVNRLGEKCVDLESRSRRNNIHEIGASEGVEGPHPTNFIEDLLQDLLKLEENHCSTLLIAPCGRSPGLVANLGPLLSGYISFMRLK